MSTQSVSRPLPPVRDEPRPTCPEPAGPPPLHPGDHLSRVEFERRYEAHPEIKTAELIEGVVYMPSPVRLVYHGEPHAWIISWLGVYGAATPGIRLGDNSSLRLDYDNEPQPDAVLCLESALGGNSRISEDGYLEGAPELIVEMAASSAAYDLHDKRRAYQRNGVREYLAVQVFEQQVDWFILREGVYETLTPDETGVLRSEMFPGLWLQPAGLWSRDLAGILATGQEGLASSEHAAFVARLEAI